MNRVERFMTLEEVSQPRPPLCTEFVLDWACLRLMIRVDVRGDIGVKDSSIRG